MSGGAFRVAYLPYHDKAYVGVGSTWCDYGKSSWPARVASDRDRSPRDSLVRMSPMATASLSSFDEIVLALVLVDIVLVVIIIVQYLSSRMI